MSSIFDRPITLRQALALALGWAAEYALLTLIESAPTSLKVATMLSATAGLAVLQAEDWLLSKGRWIFWGCATVVAAVWLSFVGYALHQVAHQDAIKAALRALYVEAGDLENTNLSLTNGPNQNQFLIDQLQLNTFCR